VKNRIVSMLLATGAIVAGAHAQSDDCNAPQPISGSGVFAYDLSGLTASQGIPNGCFQYPVPVRDGWFCWTADCTGTVTISTCSDLLVDTMLALYPASVGCSCPGDLPPMCCGDDVCGKQAKIECQVECGVRYMIRIAAKDSPQYTGHLEISCNGEPCGGNGGTPAACECCGERPPLVDSLVPPFDPGLVAAATNTRYSPGSPAVWLIDLGNQGAAPLGSNWSTDRYTHPDWTLGNLGSVFGVTLDDAGNVFVSHTAVYNGSDSTGFGGPGAIYRLDGITGTATLVVALPQQPDPAYQAPADLPGLGQLTFDCVSGRIFASNFEDGRIYSIDPNAPLGLRVKSVMDHNGTASPAIGAPPNDASIPAGPAGFAPLGDRPWAVKASGGRLYYSIWSEDSARPSASLDNTVWSVAINAAGDFVAGSARFELAMPAFSGNWSMPVADISFDDNCCMLVAERSMSSDTYTDAHASRAFRFCLGADGRWTQDIHLLVGGYGSGNNATGGIGYAGGGLDQVWNMTDAINYPSPPVYGLYGQPSAGTNAANALWVDLDGDINPGSVPKTTLGSIELNCLALAKPCEFNTTDIDCKPQADGTISFLWTLDLVNNSPVPANLLILADPAFAPNNVIVLNPPIAPGGSMTLNIPINGGSPGDTFCFAATLASSGKQECCSTEVCITLPDCSCFDTDAVATDAPGVGSFQVNLNGFTNFTNASNPPLGFPGEWVSIAVAPGYAATVTPTLVNIPTLPLFASTNVGPLTISTALPPGSPIILIVGLHSQTFHPCCFVEITVTVPAQAGSSTPGDANGDGVVNGADLAMLLSNWGLAGSTDFNGDGATDGADLAILLSNWS
jgi:hypothetical protein